MASKAWAAYATGLAGLAGIYAVAPRLAALVAAGGIAAYYAAYTAFALALALASLAASRASLASPSQEGGGASYSGPLAAAAALAGGFLLMEAILGTAPTSVSGLRGSAILALPNAATALAASAAAASAWRASEGRGAAGVVAGALLGFATLNPLTEWEALADATRGSPSAVVGAASTLVLALMVGWVALRAGRYGVLGAFPIVAAYATLAWGLPFTVARGAVGAGLAGLAGLYAAYAVLEAPPPGGPSREAFGRPVMAALVVAAVSVAVLAGLAYSGVMVWRPVVVLTGSMHGTLERGDLLVLKRPDSLRVGDIVTYRLRHVYVTHRIVGEVSPGVYVTKGDANAEPDPYTVPRDSIVGVVWARIPGAGWPLILLSWTPQLRLVAIIALAALAGAILAWPSEKGEGPPDGRG